MTNANNTLAAKGINAASRFLTHRGYDVITEENEGDAPIVAKQGDTLVFASVIVRTDNLNYEQPTRNEMETSATAYLSAHIQDIEANTQIRFDVVAILVIGPERALVRHHIGAYSRA